MATLGVVGGLGPEGTVHYYLKLTERLRALPRDGRPGLLVDHVWMDRFASLLRSGAEAPVVSLLCDSLLRLHRGGADFAVIAAVTPHKFLAALRQASPLPIVDLVEATQRDILRARHRRVGMIGTRATLTEPFFKGGLERAGIEVTVPATREIEFLDELIFGALASGPKTPAMSRDVQRIVTNMVAKARLDAIVVACTDLMELVEPVLPLVDPVASHVALAVESASSNLSG